jgi:dihydroflavonol-4-reductase
MRVLVTGATGFIGGNLVRELVKQGYRVKALVRKGSSHRALEGLKLQLVGGDLLDKTSLEKALDGCEALFHAAAMYTFWARDPELIYRTNVQGTENIFSAALVKGIKKVVYTSSESAVGITKGKYGNENMQACIEDIPSDYKKSKFMAEVLAFKMYKEGLPVTVREPHHSDRTL